MHVCMCLAQSQIAKIWTANSSGDRQSSFFFFKKNYLLYRVQILWGETILLIYWAVVVVTQQGTVVRPKVKAAPPRTPMFAVQSPDSWASLSLVQTPLPRLWVISLDATDWHGSWLHVPCLHIDLPSRGLWNRPVQLSPQWPLGREVFFSWFPHPLIYQRRVTQLAMDVTIALAFIYSHLENFKQIYILHPKKSIY